MKYPIGYQFKLFPWLDWEDFDIVLDERMQASQYEHEQWLRQEQLPQEKNHDR
jgi:hypothetical protein